LNKKNIIICTEKPLNQLLTKTNHYEKVLPFISYFLLSASKPKTKNGYGQKDITAIMIQMGHPTK
jgi:hypothetical protein